MTAFDVIVLGAGAMGSAAAYYLARAGQHVLLLEQFSFGHDRGSSHGDSRIIRLSYTHPTYIKLARAVYPMWREFEQESGETLYTKTGGLDFGPPDEPTLRDTVQSMRATGIDHEILSPRDAGKRFPQFRFDDDWQVIYQADTGMIAASKSVFAHIRLAKQHGAEVRDNTPVTRITPLVDSVEVQTPTDTYTAASLVIAAGPWAGSLLQMLDLNLPLHPLRYQPAFFQPNDSADFEPERFPCFIAHLNSTYGYWPYGLPIVNNGGLKIAFHRGETVSDMATMSYTTADGEIEQIRGFMRQHVPAANGPLVVTNICMCTYTPDEHFIIDKHPRYKNIIIAAGFSGHGFKFSTLVGSILGDLATRGSTDRDIDLFRITRFQPHTAV